MTTKNLITEVDAEPITQEQLDPLYLDYTSDEFRNNLTPRQDAFRAEVSEIFKAPNLIQNTPADIIVGQLIQQGNRIGGVDDIVARASRDVMRLKGQRLDDKGVDEIFDTYKVKLPPTSDIKFQGYDNIDDEYEKIDGWASHAKAAYNLKTKAKHPELLAYRDEVFQRVDDAAKGLKERVGSTESETVDFLGRLGQGLANFFDSVNLDGTANFIRKHVSTNPEWDADTSSIIGQSLGQAAAQIAAFVGAPAALVVAGASAPLVVAATAVGLYASNLNAGKKEREKEVLDATGSKNLADATANDPSAYLEASIDTLADATTLGLGKLGAGKLAKNFLGISGKKLFGEGLAESLAKTGASLTNLKKIAGAGGDIIYQGTKEGATEALQGAISDTSIGNYTNMKDRFEPYDLRNRAADAIGGFAGGAGISIANNFFLPKKRLQDANQEPPPDALNLDAEIRSAGEAFMNADTANDAAEANLNFIDKAAIQQTDSLLQGETVEIPKMPDLAPKEDADTFNYGNLYTGMKESLGDMINHPGVQSVAEGLVDVFNKARAFTPSLRKSPATLIEPEIAAVTTPKVDSPAIPTATVAPVAEPIQAATVAPVAEPIQAAAEVATDLKAPIEAPLDILENQLENFSPIKTALPGGGANYNFSLNSSDGQQGTAAEIKTATAAGKLDVATKDGTSIKGKNALRLDTNTYTVSTDVDGNPTSFTTTTPSGKKIVDTTINTTAKLAERTQKIVANQKRATENLRIRSETGTTANKAFEAGIPANVNSALEPSAQNFTKIALDAGSKGGGNQEEKQTIANDYLNGQAFADLVNAGVSENQAIAYIAKVKAVTGPEFKAEINGKKNPKQAVRRGVLNSLHLELADTLLGRDKLEPLVKEGYSSVRRKPKELSIQERVLGALGYVGLAEDTQTEPVTPATPKLHPLSTNTELQRRAVQNRFGDVKAEQLLEAGKENGAANYIIQTTTDDYLAGYKVSPTDSFEEARTKIDGAFNRGSFKQRKELTLTQSAYGQGRVLDRLPAATKEKLAYRTSAQRSDFESSAPADFLDDPLLPNTARYSPKDGIVVAAQLIKGQQAAFNIAHESAEAALYDNPDLENIILNSPGLASAAQSLSNSMRDTPTPDMHEHVADAVSEYFFDPEKLNDQQPELKQLLDAYAANPANATTTFAELATAYDAERAISDKQKFDEGFATASKGYEASKEALATRNEDTRSIREKAKDLLNAAHIAILNDAANVEDVAQQLIESKTPMSRLGNLFKQYLTVFKNRQQRGLLLQTAIKNSFKKLEAVGITRNQLDNYLDNNRVLNEKSFWEQTINDANITGDVFKDILYGSKTLKELIDNDPVVKEWVTKLLNDAGNGIIDSDVATTILNELAAKAFANKEGATQKIRQQLNHIKDVRIRSAINAAFDPTVEVGIKRPIEILGHTARGNLQNSGNINRTVAKQALANLQNSMSPEQYSMMENYSENVLKPAIIASISNLEASGKISTESANMYRSNANNYVTFQLADALQADPFVDASIRRSESMHGLKGTPLGATILKIGGMQVSADLQNLSNIITDMYYALDKLKKNSTIKAVALTATNGAGTNSWASRNNITNDIANNPIPLSDLIELKEKLEGQAKKTKEDLSYIISAEGGNYVLHELTDASIGKLLNPEGASDRNKVLQSLNSLQSWVRAGFTSNSLAFAGRSPSRAAANLYRNRNPQFNTQASWKDIGRAIWNAPILGVPLHKQDRQLMWAAYKAAYDYTKNAADPSRFYGTIDELFDNRTTAADIMKDFSKSVFILARQGNIPVSVEEDLSTGGSSEVNASIAGSILASNESGDMDHFITGKVKTKNILRRATDYVPSTTGKDLANKVVGGVEAYLQFVRNLNNTLELGEKLTGIVMYMQDGHAFNDAMNLTDLNFGNPSSRGGGSARSFLSPFMLYSTSTLNSLRILGSVAKGGFTEPLQDPRAVKTIGMGLRNKLAVAALPSVAYILAKAVGSDDDEAEEQAAVMDRLITNIPPSDRQNGQAIPLGFRDPRTGDFHLGIPGFGPKLADIDPSWTTVYLNLPYDHASAFFQSVVGAAGDLFDSNVGTAGVAAEFISSSIGQALPAPGPIINAGLDARQIARGINPTSSFTGEQVIEDKDFKEGGLQLGAKYVQYMASQFVPYIPTPKKGGLDKTRVFEPFESGILNQLPALFKFGVLKDSNFGQIEKNAKELNIRDQFKQQIDDAIPENARNYLGRMNELQREATRQLQITKDQLLSQGESPKNAVKRAADLLPLPFKEELVNGQRWKRQVYDVLKEKAEIALRAGDTDAYKTFIADLETATEEAKKDSGIES